MKLMIVEDNTPMRRLLRSIVTRLADQICECSDGTEAVAAYPVHHPDWVLMDVEMEPMDGLTATRQIKARFANANIVIVTQYDDAATRAAAREAGAIAYVHKGNLETVRNIVSRAPPSQGET